MTINSYEEMPYPGYTIMETHPGRVAAIGRLHGIPTADPATARVLELGCGVGMNLLAIAQVFPKGEFVGIDLAEVHIEQARCAAIETGMAGRVNFLREDISSLSGDIGMFDTIICHGVYSWVPTEVRNSILDLCRDHLNPNGIAYISYNCLPGWKARGAIREMMLHHTEGIGAMRERVAKARSLTDFLATIVPEELPHGKFLRREASYLKGKDDSYIAHDYLASINDPMYFRDFVREVSAHGLGYLGDANPWNMRADDLAPASAAQLKQMAAGPVEWGQYLDYIRDQTFRCTLLCHAGAERYQGPDPRLLEGLYVSGRLMLKEPYRNGRAVFTKTEGGEVAVSRPTVAALLTKVTAIGPVAMESRPLIEEVLSSLGGGFDGLSGEGAVIELQRILLSAYHGQLIDLTVGLPSPAGIPSSSHPSALPVARWQASQGVGVSAGDLRHVGTDDLLRNFISLSDGTRNKGAIVAGMMEAFAKGKISIQGKEALFKDSKQVEALLSGRYEAILSHLGKLGVMRDSK